MEIHSTRVISAEWRLKIFYNCSVHHSRASSSLAGKAHVVLSGASASACTHAAALPSEKSRGGLMPHLAAPTLVRVLLQQNLERLVQLLAASNFSLPFCLKLTQIHPMTCRCLNPTGQFSFLILLDQTAAPDTLAVLSHPSGTALHAFLPHRSSFLDPSPPHPSRLFQLQVPRAQFPYLLLYQYSPLWGFHPISML